MADQILFLNGIWICPINQIAFNTLEEPYLDPVCIGIRLTDGDLDIIILQEEVGYRIHAIERHIRCKVQNS